MLDLGVNSFLDKVLFERKVLTPTDSVFTQIEGDPKEFRIKKIYDVQPVLERVADLRKLNEENRGFSDLKHFRIIGSIPTHVWLKFQQWAGGDEIEIRRLEKRWLKANPEFCAVNRKTF